MLQGFRAPQTYLVLIPGRGLGPRERSVEQYQMLQFGFKCLRRVGVPLRGRAPEIQPVQRLYQRRRVSLVFPNALGVPVAD